ncbi:MAG: DedA family protein [Bacteroidetes bacterium]|jgi:membrane protein YqaA with SNARE-associated domain|nr:DedA family protein [Bacteroidota bacterium]
MKFLKTIYNWVLNLSTKKIGPTALFFIAMSESVFFPIPPDVLLIALAIGFRKRALFFGAVCFAGSILGAIIGYIIGYNLWWESMDVYSQFAYFFYNHIPGFTIEKFIKIQQLYEQYNFYIIFTAGFTPLPYKIFTLTAGAYAINFPMFIIASMVSRGTRFFLIAGLIWKYGKPIKEFIDKYFNLLAIVFTILLFGSFYLLKYVL